MANNTCSICEKTFDKCECVLEYAGMDIEVAALMQEVRELREQIVATCQSRARAVWAFKRMRQAAEHWSEAHSRELKAHYDSMVVIMAARNTVAAWEKLCSCVDEFGAGSEYCGEQADVVDKRIVEMRTALATFGANTTGDMKAPESVMSSDNP